MGKLLPRSPKEEANPIRELNFHSTPCNQLTMKGLCLSRNFKVTSHFFGLKIAPSIGRLVYDLTQPLVFQSQELLRGPKNGRYEMNLKIQTLRPVAALLRSFISKAAIPALILGVGLFICSTRASAQQTCGYGTGHSCTDNGKGNGSNSDSTPVPEPSALLQLGAGISGLAFVGRKRLFARKS